MLVAGGSVISNGVPIKVHSNAPDAADKSLTIGVSPTSTGTIVGDASACGTISTTDGDGNVVGFITGTPEENSDYIEPPPFDDSFFAHYYSVAKTYSGNQIFTSNPFASIPNKVIYVTGQVTLRGTWTMTGCIIATSKIVINDTAPGGKITQQKAADPIEPAKDLPAFLSKNNNIEIYDPTTINGVVYAKGRIIVNSSHGLTGNTVIYGSVYAEQRINFNAKIDLHYEEPSVAGFSPLEIESWSRWRR